MLLFEDIVGCLAGVDLGTEIKWIDRGAFCCL